MSVSVPTVISALARKTAREHFILMREMTLQRRCGCKNLINTNMIHKGVNPVAALAPRTPEAAAHAASQTAVVARLQRILDFPISAKAQQSDTFIP